MSGALGKRPRARRGDPAHDAGFTLIEVTVSAAILALLAAAIIPAFSSALVTTAASEQRQVATSLMNEAMEAVRALPFATVANGLDNAEVASSNDPRISIAGSTYTFTNGEVIPHGNLGYTQEPLVPHLTERAIGSSSYTVGVYPTRFEGSDSILRITVIVEWDATLRPGGENRIQSQSVIYSDPTGCLSSTTHPFSAPCQPFLYSTASTGAGSLAITPAPGATTPLGGIALTRAELTLASATSTMQVEQISAVNTRSVTSTALIETTSATGAGGVLAPAGVDDDPGSSSPTAQTQDATQSGSAISASDGTNVITVTPGSTDSGNATSTIAASASPACQDLAGTALLTSAPCGAGRIQHTGTTGSITMNLTAGTTGLGETPLGTVAAAPSIARTFSSRHLEPHASYCTSASGDGCVHAGSERTFGTIELAGLPPQLVTNGAAPSGWTSNYLLRVDNYGDRTHSEHGAGAASPTATQFAATGSGTPTLRYWNGSGYTDLDITWGASSPSITVPDVVVTDTSIPGGDVVVTISATIETGAATTSSDGPPGCDESCTASATVASPLIADILYSVVYDGSTIADLNLRFDLGSNIATTSYRAAPSEA